MKIFSCLSGGNNKLKKSLQASDDEVVSLKQELDERNKLLKAMEEKHAEERHVKAEEVKILEEKNSEYTAKIEELASRDFELETANKVFVEEKQELTAQISKLNILCSDYKDQVESHREKGIQSGSAQGNSCAAMETAGDKEIQHAIEILERRNEELEAALAYEKKKTQKRKQEASNRRARFKERVQNLTRKLSDDDSSSGASDDAPTTGSLIGTPKVGNTPKLADTSD